MQGIERLRVLYQEAEALRAELGIHRPGEVIYQQPAEDEHCFVLVVADGLGGAAVYEVYAKHGPFPLHHTELGHQQFTTEAAALKHADTVGAEEIDADVDA